MFIELAMQKHGIYWNEFNLNVSCLVVVQNMMHNKIVQKITSFLQRMSDKELHRRLVTGTINTCSVTAKTVTMLSTNAQKSITQAKVWLLFEKRYYKFLPLFKWEKLIKRETHLTDFKISLFFPENVNSIKLWANSHVCDFFLLQNGRLSEVYSVAAKW